MEGDKGDVLAQLGSSGPLNIEMGTHFNTHANSQAAPSVPGSQSGLASAKGLGADRGLLGSEMYRDGARTAATGPSSRAQPDTPGQNAGELCNFPGRRVVRRQNSNTVGQANSQAGRSK